MLGVSQRQFLVLLFVVQAQHDTSQRFVVKEACKQPLHFLVNVRAKGQNLVEGWPGEGCARRLVGNPFSEREVIAVEKAMKLLTKGPVTGQIGPQHESFKEPGSMRLMPFDGTGI